MDPSVQLLNRCESYKAFQETFKRIENDLSALSQRGHSSHLVDLIKRFSIWKFQFPELIQELGQALKKETKSWEDQEEAKQAIEFWNKQAPLISSTVNSSVTQIENQILFFHPLQSNRLEQLTEISKLYHTRVEHLEESLKSCENILLENQLLKDILDSRRILLGATALLPLLQQAESVPSSQT